MSGKIAGIFIVLAAVVGGVAMYALQLYAFYDEVPESDLQIQLTSLVSGMPEPILASNVQAIDADSSPIRYRACFTTDHSQAMLTETYVVYDTPDPLTGPGWFDCYDAQEIGETLKAEKAIAYLSQANIAQGVDRVVAIFDDGRGFVWHQISPDFQD